MQQYRLVFQRNSSSFSGDGTTITRKKAAMSNPTNTNSFTLPALDITAAKAVWPKNPKKNKRLPNFHGPTVSRITQGGAQSIRGKDAVKQVRKSFLDETALSRARRLDMPCSRECGGRGSRQGKHKWRRMDFRKVGNTKTEEPKGISYSFLGGWKSNPI